MDMGRVLQLLGKMEELRFVITEKEMRLLKSLQ